MFATATLVAATLLRLQPYSHLLGGGGGRSTLPPDAIRDAALAGELPFTADQLRGLLPPHMVGNAAAHSQGASYTSGAAEQLAQLLQRCWAIDPVDRPDAGDIADTLLTALAEAGGEANAPACIPIPQGAADAVVASSKLAREAISSQMSFPAAAQSSQAAGEIALHAKPPPTSDAHASAASTLLVGNSSEHADPSKRLSNSSVATTAPPAAVVGTSTSAAQAAQFNEFVASVTPPARPAPRSGAHTTYCQFAVPVYRFLPS